MSGRTLAGLVSGAIFALVWIPSTRGQTVGTSRTRIHDQEAEAEQKLLADARAALEQKDYRTAAQKYRDYLEKKPDDAFAHFQLGYAYTAMLRPADARTEYEKAVELDPQMEAAYTNLGMTLLALGDASGAVEPLQEAADMVPADAHAKYLVGVALEQSGKAAEAVEQYEAAKKLDDKNAEVRVALGRVLLASNQPADAEAEFRAAIALQPNLAEAHLELARSLIAEKKTAEAAAELGAYLKSQPDDSEARLEMAALLIGSGKYDEAVAELDRAAPANLSTPGKMGAGSDPRAGGRTESLRVLSLRAEAYIGENNYAAAIPVLQKAAALDPRDPQFPAALGHAYLEKKDYSDAVRTLYAAFKMDPKSNEVLSDLIAAEYESKNYQAALQGIDLLSQRRDLPPPTWFVRASCYDNLRDAAHALDAYRKFLQLNKDQNSDMYFAAAERVRVLERELQGKKR